MFRAFRDYKAEYEKDNIVDGPVYEEQKPSVDPNRVVYKVQIESRGRKLENASQHYKNLEKVDFYEHNGQYKYTAGLFYSKNEADEYCKKVKSYGYSTAFVVSFKNGKRL